MATETIENGFTDTTTMQDALEDAAAEKLAEEAVADSSTSDEEEESATLQGGLLPRMGEQTALDGEGFEKPVKTRRQLAEEMLEHFQGDVEKAQTAVGNARSKLSAAIVLRDDAEENLRQAIRAEKEEAETEEAATDAAVVYVLFPGDDETYATPVGQFTRYGELVADYGTAAGIEVTMGDYVVIGPDGKERDLGAGIARADWGNELEVRRVKESAA